MEVDVRPQHWGETQRAIMKGGAAGEGSQQYAKKESAEGERGAGGRRAARLPQFLFSPSERLTNGCLTTLHGGGGGRGEGRGGEERRGREGGKKYDGG